jgi:DNA-binding IclR family transcriptional regulator
MPRASVFRTLHTLERAGFIERMGDSANYRLGLGLLRLGFEYLASMELAEHGRSVLESLSAASGYSAHLVVRDQQQVVFIAKAVGRNAQFHSIQVGARLPAHATVLGRLLMSDLGMTALTALYPETPLPKFTKLTPTTLPKLKAMIDAHRTQGYAISQSGFETGISTIAAPVFNDRHQVVAVVSITVPAQQVPIEQAKLLVPQVQQAAAVLSNRISHLPQSGG